MITLGVNGFFNADHDAGSALVVDGRVVAAVEEERLVRLKKAPGLPPTESALEVLDLGGIGADDVDVLAYPWRPEPLGLDSAQEANDILASLRAKGVGLRPDVRVHFVAHHLAHAWAGLVYLPPEERGGAVAIALDGCGESTAGARFDVTDGSAEVAWHLPITSSLGAFYEAATAVVGFGWGEEGKTMGLASYAGSSSAGESATLPDSRFTGPLPRLDVDYVALVDQLARELVDELGQPQNFVERAAVAAVAQRRLTDQVWYLVEDTSAPVVVLSGGTALNCMTNGEIAVRLARRGQRLVIPPPASDTGVALGAAVATAHEHDDVEHLDTALTGREFSADEVAAAFADEGVAMAASSTESLVRRLHAGAVVGWFADRAEIGPRALGARSIVARPESESRRDRINLIKGRETWRPLAPSVTAAEFDRSFDGCPSPYMLKASRVRPGAQGLGAVTHVDGTARPQVVTDAGAYAELVAGMGRGGDPQAVVCTSFNRAGEPIVYTPTHALRSARAMGLDAIAGDGWIVNLKEGGDHAGASART